MGAVDYFLNIDNVVGESEDATHKGEIEIENWQFGETQQGKSVHGSGASAGRVSMQDFRFTKRVDKATPKLMLLCANGQHIKKALLTARKAGTVPQEYLKVAFHDCLISNFQDTGSSQDDVPREQIAFNFSSFDMDYREQLADGNLGGSVKAGYDLKKNTAY
jgi:type VI secretion system secreted protein Hcp